MDKLAWVALPLLLALLALAVAWWRRRPPSRLALNVVSSLLLLVYLGVTAGLGIFWVANQHLPVFDWHYLFGYATVLLLLVHLGFNGPLVLRFLAQRRTKKAAAAGAPGPATTRRLPVLGLLGAGALAAGAYGLGLRHGRTELRVDTAAGEGTGTAEGAAAALAVVEAFHEFSAHSRQGLFRRAPGAEWGGSPPPFKAYPGLAPLALPPPLAQAPSPAGDPAPLDLPRLATLLFAAAGVNLRRGGIHFRAAPSSGALFATELYLRVQRVAGLAPGLYHYHGSEHRLVRLPGAAVADTTPMVADAELVATAVFRRSGHKYRDRAYRYILADLGHGLENLRAAAEVLGVAAWPYAHFDEAAESARYVLDEAEEGVLGVAAWPFTHFDEAAEAALYGLDEAEEGVLARWALGQGSAEAVAATAQQAWVPAPLSVSGTLGVTEAIHRATSLRAAGAFAARPVVEVSTAEAAASGAAEAGPRRHRLPPPARSPMPLLERITRRRSERRYTAETLTQPQLSALLDALLRRPGPVYSSAVRVHLLTAAVEGLPAAAWRYHPADHALQWQQDQAELRDRARSAALAQDVVGDAAAVVVLALDQAGWRADPAGAARGYRHAFLEAGLVGERLYLEATALGLGCCGVGAFYDDEAAALLGLDPAQEWVVHFATVGRLAG
jgi:SagB-type dehydrogenase family enzyme